MIFCPILAVARSLGAPTAIVCAKAVTTMVARIAADLDIMTRTGNGGWGSVQEDGGGEQCGLNNVSPLQGRPIYTMTALITRGCMAASSSIRRATAGVPRRKSGVSVDGRVSSVKSVLRGSVLTYKRAVKDRASAKGSAERVWARERRQCNFVFSRC